MNLRYRKLGQILGEGSYKSVSKAIDEEEGKEVAYNEVRIKQYEAETQAGTSFSKEIALLKNIDHPNIIKILDYWFTEEDFVFVTELMTGGTLREYISKVGPLNCKLIRKWGKQILEGLKYLHTLNPPIIHRDIKNENIFVNSAQGEIKIGDLGIAREKKNKRYTIVGTPNFMAREMFEGEGYSEKVDIYAFGMCLIEMATGSTPYAELHESNDVYRSVLQGVLPKALHMVGSPCLCSLIMNCLVAQPNRFSADECLAHHFFNVEVACSGECLPPECATILPLSSSSGGMKLSLLALSGTVLTFQLVLSGSLRFIKFDYDLSRDTLERVSDELRNERIIEESAVEAFKGLLERGIEKALAKRERGQIVRGIIELDAGESAEVGDERVLHGDEREVCGIKELEGERLELGDKTLEVMKEIDEEMRMIEEQRAEAKTAHGSDVKMAHSSDMKMAHGSDVKTEAPVSPLLTPPGESGTKCATWHDGLHTTLHDSTHGSAPPTINNILCGDYYYLTLQKYAADAPLATFVADAASITGRGEDTAKNWLTSLTDESLRTVFDLKILAYEDWERLSLTVFSCRVMQNMLYGPNNTPVREKHLLANPTIREYSNSIGIREFLEEVCAEISRNDMAGIMESRLLAQDIRTVGELRSLHPDDWNRLGLSVFGCRILKNVIFQRGYIKIDRIHSD